MSKVYIVWAKKCRGVFFREPEEGYKIWRGINFSFQNWHKELDIFLPQHSKVSKILTLMRSFWAKYTLFELKKYRGVIFHDMEERCKIWRKTDVLLGKWQEEFGKFSLEHSKVSKLGLWWDPLVQSRKGITLKLQSHDNKEKWKKKTCQRLEEKDLSFQNWHEEFNEFWLKQTKI